jgi:hypothetical protein
MATLNNFLSTFFALPLSSYSSLRDPLEQFDVSTVPRSLGARPCMVLLLRGRKWG